ncbi:hypothetical protein BN2475_340159 [Paraburkholderia ribeironis]|uniref:Uncharacterized protein n=1 Tax=Paraburkholderia ribeironis TaxID=1247936 RepID=A0A1N7S4F3_9BURK|nr:hypothetical protein BN2475_340159 [Paraburkholderia ribeironis]
MDALDGCPRRTPSIDAPDECPHVDVPMRASRGRPNECRTAAGNDTAAHDGGNVAGPPSGHATIAVLRAVATVAKRRAVFAGRHACPHR